MNKHKLHVLLFLGCLIFSEARVAASFAPWPLMRSAASWTKDALVTGGKDVVKLVVAQGLVYFIGSLWANHIAASYGNATRSQALQNRNPQPCPADKGLIAPETVPAEIKRVNELINNPEKLNRLGAHLWRGVLLTGVPGTGKTELGYYIAKQTGQPVVYEGAMGLIDAAQGSGARSLRELIARAATVTFKDRLKMAWRKFVSIIRRRPYQPRRLCVVVLDEIDAIGQKRQGAIAGLDRAREAERVRALEQLLTELDGAHQPGALPDVFLVATSNLPVAALDEALVRPGRLNVINIPPLTRQNRVDILNYHARRVPTPLAPDVDFNALLEGHNNLTGADLANIINDAKLTVANRPEQLIYQQDLLNALRNQRATYQRNHEEILPVD